MSRFIGRQFLSGLKYLIVLLGIRFASEVACVGFGLFGGVDALFSLNDDFPLHS